MININLEKLEQVLVGQKQLLKDGLISSDIWDIATGLSLANHNGLPEATALFNQLTTDLLVILDGSGLPSLNRFYLLNLEAEKMVVIVRHGEDLLQGLLLDPQKVNLGVVFSLVVPKSIAQVAEARQS